MHAESFRIWIEGLDLLAVWNALGLTILIGLLLSVALYSNEDEP